MVRRKVKVDDLDDVINEILEDYGSNVRAGVRTAVERVAKIAAQETKAGAPKRTGTYMRGWAVSTDTDMTSQLYEGRIVHNRSRYQLAHLLEKGHAKRGGGRVNGIEHIAQAEQTAIKNLEEAIKRIAEG